MSDWGMISAVVSWVAWLTNGRSTEASDDDVPKAAPSAPAPKKPVKSKWEGEDEEDDGPVVRLLYVSNIHDRVNVSYQSDWEASSEEEEEKPAPAPVAPPKKKGTLKQKLAEKEALKAQKAADGEDDYDEDSVLDPREKARRDKEKELASDMNNAADLFGAVGLGGAFPAWLWRGFLGAQRCWAIRYILQGARLADFSTAPDKGGLRRVFGQDHRVHRQATPEQAAVRHLPRAPCSRTCHAPMRCGGPQGG